jgi:hypothetical protein
MSERPTASANQIVMPPGIAVTSPIHEMLVLDVAAGTPWELREPLRGARTVAELNDWIAAASMWRWIEGDPHLKRLFLDTLDGDPRRAPLALARAMAASMDPPPRDEAWHRADRDGLVLQCVLVVLVITARTIAGAWLDDSRAAGALAMAAWHGCELTVGPQLFERVRRLPARARRLRPPLAWRADAFAVLWRLQALVFLAAAIARAITAFGW